MTRAGALRALARIGPATAIALVATGVSATVYRRMGAIADAGDGVRVATLAMNAALWWGFAAVSVSRTPPVQRGPWIRGSLLVGLACASALLVRPAAAVDAGWIQIGASGIVSLGSLALAAGALGRLGRCFGVLPDARGLVTSGPYRLVRHPIYLGELGAVAGLAVAAPEARNLLALVCMTAAQIARARLEERTLLRAFPQYAEYAARTPMLLPRPRAAVCATASEVTAGAR